MAVDLREQLQASLGEAYHLERELGGGGMSRVFVALETALGRRVVVKVLLPELAASVSVDRFRREILFAAQLQHPHIVPVLAAGESGGLPYFTMPFVSGESLRARLLRDGELPLAEAVRVLRDVASALAYAHQEGVVHRDIKPDNVLISHGVAVVTDFGVAKALTMSAGALALARAPGTGLTSLGLALGTPTYMSPEQASGDPGMDHRVDVYSFGVMAYEVLTGQPPFGGRTPQAVLGAHMAALPEPVTTRRPGIPPLLALLVMRCLEKRAADRPQTAADIMSTLDMLTTPSGGTVPVPALQRRRGARWAASARDVARRVWPAAVGLALAVPVVLWLRSRRAEISAPPATSAAVPAPAPPTPARPAPVPEPAPPLESAKPTKPEAAPRRPEPPRPAAQETALLARLRLEAANARARAVAAGAPAEVLARGDAGVARAESLGRRGSAAEAAAELSAVAALWSGAAERPPAPAAPQPIPAETAAAAGPAAPAKPTPAPPAPAVDPRPQILSVFEQYGAAIESRNVEAIQRVYPGMRPEQAREWEQFFQVVSDIDVDLGVSGLNVSGNTAEAQLTGVYVFTDPGTRRPRHENVSFVASLSRDGGRWLIQSLH